MSRIAQTATPKREVHTGDLPVGQAPRITLGADDEIDHEQVIVPIDSPLGSDQMQNLAFAEEPVTIRIERSNEKHAPIVVDCWVNGKGAEVFVNGKWTEFGCLPVGIPVTTKRKYVEILARSKIDNVTTNTGTIHDANPVNHIDRATSSKVPFSMIQDRNPLGVEWLTRLLQEG